MFYIVIWMVVTQMFTHGNIYWIFHRRFIIYIYTHTYNASIKKLKSKTLQLDNQITGTLQNVTSTR